MSSRTRSRSRSPAPRAAPASDAMYGVVERVDPDTARAWLSKSVGNRNVSEYSVAGFERMIHAGQWQASDQGISFSPAGVLVNGHHRLEAIVRAGVAVDAFVVRNVSHEAQAVIDTYMRPRSAGDILALFDGDEQAKIHVAIVRMMAILYKGAVVKLTVPEVRAALVRHREAIGWATALVMPGRIGKSALLRGTLAYAYVADPAMVRQFVADVLAGEAPVEHPARALRDHLLGAKVSSGSHEWRMMEASRVLGAVIAARSGRVNVKQLRGGPGAIDHFRKFHEPFTAGDAPATDAAATSA